MKQIVDEFERLALPAEFRHDHRSQRRRGRRRLSLRRDRVRESEAGAFFKALHHVGKRLPKAFRGFPEARCLRFVKGVLIARAGDDFPAPAFRQRLEAVGDVDFAVGAASDPGFHFRRARQTGGFAGVGRIFFAAVQRAINALASAIFVPNDRVLKPRGAIAEQPARNRNRRRRLPAPCVALQKKGVLEFLFEPVDHGARPQGFRKNGGRFRLHRRVVGCIERSAQTVDRVFRGVERGDDVSQQVFCPALRPLEGVNRQDFWFVDGGSNRDAPRTVDKHHGFARGGNIRASGGKAL